MSVVRFISDLHFNHKNIVKYSEGYREGSTMEEHNQWLIDQWNSVVSKSDLTWILGDVSFDKEGIELVKKLNGVKHLILGNHDTFPLDNYIKVFNKIHGFMKYKGFILSHAPIRKESLRGRFNIHGHTHGEIIVNGSYINVCVEALNGIPIGFEKIKELVKIDN